MKQIHQETWVQHQPYTVMLHQYRDAANRLKQRITMLSLELKAMQDRSGDSAESADRQRTLEQRVDLLRTEYYEITDCMQEIAVYAEKEQQ